MLKKLQIVTNLIGDTILRILQVYLFFAMLHYIVLSVKTKDLLLSNSYVQTMCLILIIFLIIGMYKKYLLDNDKLIKELEKENNVEKNNKVG